MKDNVSAVWICGLAGSLGRWLGRGRGRHWWLRRDGLTTERLVLCIQGGLIARQTLGPMSPPETRCTMYVGAAAFNKFGDSAPAQLRWTANRRQQPWN